MAKTDWKMDDTVMPADMNQIGQEINDLNESVEAATSVATANAIIKRDASGRAKVAAPVEPDDIARKADIDEVKQSGSEWKKDIADTITALGPVVSAEDPKQTYIDKINSLKVGTEWTMITAPPTAGNLWKQVTYGNGMFVAIGYSGTERLMTSLDGINWTSKTILGLSFQAITFGNGLFVAVATNGVMTSPDGITWTWRSSPADNSWRSITYGNGLFVAVSFGGDQRLMTSPDGINWTLRNCPTSGWGSIIYANGMFVALSGTDIMISGEIVDPEDKVKLYTPGYYWTPTKVYGRLNFTGAVAYGNGMFVAISQYTDSHKILTSIDGNNWIVRDNPYPGNWNDITYGNGLFVAVGGSSGSGYPNIMTSEDGINWITQTAPFDTQWISITFGNGLFVAGCYVDSGRGIMTSPDGINWTLGSTISIPGTIRSIVYGNGKYIAVIRGNNAQTISNLIMSTDGINWNTIPVDTSYDWYAITYGNGKFVAVSSDIYNPTCKVITSPDGITWTMADIPSDAWFYITYGPSPLNSNGVFIITGYTNTFLYSFDGLTWTTQYAPNTGGKTIYGNNTFIQVSYSDSYIMKSSYGSTNWDFANVPFTSQNFSSIAYGNGLFVAVSRTSKQNAIVVSRDGINWIYINTQVETNWQSVAYGNGIFVAVGDIGSVRAMYSSDGFNWTLRSIPLVGWMSVAHGYLSPTYETGVFVAVARTGTNNRIMISPNGITWTNIATSDELDLNWRSVTYGNGRFIAVATDGTRNVMSSTNGTTWQLRSNPVGLWYSVTYGNGIFIAINTSVIISETRMMISADGYSWKAVSSPSSDTFKAIAFGNGVFVLITNKGMLLSKDGITWVDQTSYYSSSLLNIESVTYGNGRFVAVGNSNNEFLYSGELNDPSEYDDQSLKVVRPGIQWTFRAAPDMAWKSVTYGNGIFVAVANSSTGNRVMTSHNGVEWIQRPAASNTHSWNCVTYGNGIFVAVSGSGAGQRVMTSPDGITWTMRNSPDTITWLNVIYAGNRFVAVGKDGAMTSPDGITWTLRSTPIGTWNSVAFGNGVYVAVSISGTVMTSHTNGETWTLRSSVNSSIGWYSVTFGQGKFIAVSADATTTTILMSSPDGINWTPMSVQSTSNTFRFITYADGLFIAISTARFMISPDGINWKRMLVTAETWESIAYGRGLFVAVATIGTYRLATSGYTG